MERDLPFLAALYASTRWDELLPTGWPDDLKQAFLKQQFDAQHAHYSAHYADAEFLVVKRARTRIGRLILDRRPGDLRVVDISLGPEHRGLGLGGAMLADILDDAARLEACVSIHVEKGNPARRLYVRLGFHVEGDQGVYDLMIWRPHAAPCAEAPSDAAQQ